MTKSTGPRRVALYARISQEREQSVSIEQQLDTMRAEAARRGWEVVLVEADRSVSATKRRPDQRPAFRRLLAASGQYDALMVWRLDRLTRRLTDYADVIRALRADDIVFVSVVDNVDLSTPEGRLMANVLASFAEWEAETIGLRVTANRHRLVREERRRAGGRPPFGFVNVKNPDGPGLILAHDSERIDIVRDLVNRALDGESLYALTKHLNDSGVRPPRAGRWSPESVEAILRNPTLAGMVPFTPGRKPGEKTVEVLRDEAGEPVIDETVAILTPEEHADLVAALDARKAPGARRPRGDVEAAMLSGIIRCGSCRRPLYRATGNGYHYYRCQNRDCAQPVQVNRDKVEAHVADLFASAFAETPAYRVEIVKGSPEVAKIEAAIESAWQRVREVTGSERLRIMERIEADEARLADLRSSGSATSHTRLVPTGRTVAEEWSDLDTDAERNAFLRDGYVSVVVQPGRGFTTDRIVVDLPFADAEPGEPVDLPVLEG